MKQLDLFNPEIEAETSILGLQYIENYIKKEKELELLEIIDHQEWSQVLKRRVQHYGYRYDYKNKQIDRRDYLGPIPGWVVAISNKLLEDRLLLTMPDQIIINEYMPGQGIAPHIDCIPCFGEAICSLSLGSDCIMDFTRSGNKIAKLLSARSLLLLTRDARYLWAHSIAARKSDNHQGANISRQRRVSLTFRLVKSA